MEVIPKGKRNYPFDFLRTECGLENLSELIFLQR
jgi:hypothetical protein